MTGILFVSELLIMKAVLYAVTLDPYGDLSHYVSRECLDSLHVTTCALQSFTYSEMLMLIPLCPLIAGVEVTLNGASLSGYVT